MKNIKSVKVHVLNIFHSLLQKLTALDRNSRFYGIRKKRLCLFNLDSCQCACTIWQVNLTYQVTNTIATV